MMTVKYSVYVYIASLQFLYYLLILFLNMLFMKQAMKFYFYKTFLYYIYIRDDQLSAKIDQRWI